MQGKTKLYVDKNPANVDKISPNIDKIKAKKRPIFEPKLMVLTLLYHEKHHLL